MPVRPATAILMIDPYNDFLHPNGKLTSTLADSLAASDTIKHLKVLHATARDHDLPIFYGLHQQYHPDQYTGWQHMSATHHGLQDKKMFEEGSWGAQIYKGLEPDGEKGDVVVSKHWGSR